MASPVPLRNHRITLWHDEMEEIKALFQTQSDISESLRMLSEIRETPDHLSATNAEATKNRIDVAFVRLPCLLRTMADALDHRTRNAIEAIHAMTTQRGDREPGDSLEKPIAERCSQDDARP